MILGDKPAGIKNIVDNPCFGMENFRLRDEYFSVIKEVRSSIDDTLNNRIQLPDTAL
jgi:hypothetical protein